MYKVIQHAQDKINSSLTGIAKELAEEDLREIAKGKDTDDEKIKMIREKFLTTSTSVAEVVDITEDNATAELIDISSLLDLNTMPLKMIKVKAGKFQMGSPKNELERGIFETLHWVTLTKDYWLGETEVTQGQWKAVMGGNPSYSKKGDDYPVESVSWDDAMAFCEKLNKRYEGKLPSGYKFSLPTEAQWEYACRAGTTTALNSGRDLIGKEKCPNLNELGWYSYNKGNENYTHPVALKRRNAWGFYDMHGNVWEWCRDWYDSYNGDDETDPIGPETGSKRLLRGGGWSNSAWRCRSAWREGSTPSERYGNVGFRVALVPVQ